MSDVITATIIQWGFDVAGLAFLLVLVQEPLYSAANGWADDMERHLPWFLDWHHVGNPASWLHHTFFALCVAGLGALFGVYAGSAAIGAAHWSVGGAAFYLQREIRTSIKKGRVGLDEVMDTVGPLLVLVLCWWWAL